MSSRREMSKWIFFLFVFWLSVKICVRSIWNEKEQFCLSLKIQSDTFTTSSTAESSDWPIVANINNNPHQQSLTHNHVTKKNRVRRRKKKKYGRGNNMVWRCRRKMVWKRTGNSLWCSMTNTLIAEGQRCGPLFYVHVSVCGLLVCSV